MIKFPFFEKLAFLQRKSPNKVEVITPKMEDGVTRKLPDGTVLWADNQEALDEAYERLKEEHELRS